MQVIKYKVGKTTEGESVAEHRRIFLFHECSDDFLERTTFD